MLLRVGTMAYYCYKPKWRVATCHSWSHVKEPINTRFYISNILNFISAFGRTFQTEIHTLRDWNILWCLVLHLRLYIKNILKELQDNQLQNQILLSFLSCIIEVIRFSTENFLLRPQCEKGDADVKSVIYIYIKAHNNSSFIHSFVYIN